MPSFLLLSPTAMGFVPAFLMQIVILVALLTWIRKTRSTWLLIGWQIMLSLLVACFLAAHSIYAPFGGYIYWMGGITFAWLSAVFGIQFAYHFPRLIYPREARLALLISLAFPLAFVALMAVEAFSQSNILQYVFAGFYYEPLGSGTTPTLASVWLFDLLYPPIFFWPALIWLRHCVQQAPGRPAGFGPAWWRHIGRALRAPQQHDARTARMMALVMSVALLSPLASMLEERNLVPVSTFAASFLIAKALFFLVYLDYAPEWTPLRSRFVAITLVTILLLAGVFAPMMLQWSQASYHSARHDESTTIKSLLAAGIYDQMPAAVMYVATRPAAGGLFAESYQMLFQHESVVDAPMLAAQDARLRAIAGQELSAVSWRHISRVHPWLREQFAGIPSVQDLADLRIPEGAVSYRGHFDPPAQHIIRYSFQLDATTLAEAGYSYPAYRWMLHERALPLAGLTLAAVPLFFLLVPLFIQVSLIQPLAALRDGLRRVEEGDLQTRVPVRQADDIGVLAESFNGMIGSLRSSQATLLEEVAMRRQKERELSALAATLEQRVADRTRELLMTNQYLQQAIQERQQAEQHSLDQERAITMLHERERLARELHDDLGQVLGYVNTQAQTLRDLLQRGDPSAALPLLDHLVATVQHTSTDIREYILGVQVGTTLQPAVSDVPLSTGLVDIIKAYVSQFREMHGIDVRASLAPGLADMRFSPTLELHLLRVVQEALTNVRKHAQAGQVLVSLAHAQDVLQLAIIDDGQGFQLPAADAIAQPDGSGYGLSSMRGRVAEIGGTLAIETAPGAGTRLHVTVPLRRQGDITRHALRLLLVDDNPLFMQGLHNLLTVRGFQVVGTAANGNEAQVRAQELQPDVILMDVHMPECDGLEATRAIKASLPHIQIVMLTVSDDDANLFEAIKQGAAGYLLKSLEGDDLCDMLLSLRQGDMPLSPGLAGRILREFAGNSQPDSSAGDTPAAGATPALSDQQIALLSLLARGLTQKEVGERLGYTARTIRRHMTEIIAILHMSSRTEAIAYAQQKLTMGEWPALDG